MLQKSNDVLTGTWKTRSLGMWQMQRSPKRQLGGIIGPAKISENHIARTISAQKYCDDDQESLRLKISDWKERSPQTRFFYRTRDDPPASSEQTGKNSSEESGFLFVHQEPWQQRFLERVR